MKFQMAQREGDSSLEVISERQTRRPSTTTKPVSLRLTDFTIEAETKDIVNNILPRPYQSPTLTAGCISKVC